MFALFCIGGLQNSVELCKNDTYSFLLLKHSLPIISFDFSVCIWIFLKQGYNKIASGILDVIINCSMKQILHSKISKKVPSRQTKFPVLPKKSSIFPRQIFKGIAVDLEPNNIKYDLTKARPICTHRRNLATI